MSGQDLIDMLDDRNERICPNCLWPLEHCACKSGRVLMAAATLGLIALTLVFMI